MKQTTVEATVTKREGNLITAKIETLGVSGEFTIDVSGERRIALHTNSNGVFADAEWPDGGDIILVDFRRPHISRPVS